MDEQLETIISTVNKLNSNLEKGESITKSNIQNSKDGISLLAYKNHAMLSYLQNLALVTATQVARSSKDVEQIRENAIKGTVTQRIGLEKGVKGLEAKMSYQIEKVLRANFKANQPQETTKKTQDNEDSEEDSDDEDALNYKPNPTGMENNKDEGRSAGITSTTDSNAKYQAPKISAVTPFDKEGRKTSRQQRNATMEEYLRHSSAAPVAEPSIGSNIMDNGRGGERNEKDRLKQKEVQDYEEENLTRIGLKSKKEEKKAARKRQRDAYGKNLFGENWGLSSGIERATKRKDKPSSVWERTKKRQRRG